MPQDKIYLKCSAKEHIFPDGGAILKLSFKRDDMADFCNDHANERGYVNLILGRRKSVGQYGDTHSVVLDTWKPDGSKAKAKPVAKGEDIP